MEWTDWMAYLSALLVVVASPGTSTMLVVAQTIQHGRQQGLQTAIGDLTANALQLTVVSLASTAVLDGVALHAAKLKWGAVAYLLVTGLRLIGSRPQSGRVLTGSSGSAFLSGFLVSISNPSAILFFALLLPLFVQESSPVLPQFAILGAVALMMDGLFLAAFIGAAAALQRSFQHRRSAISGQQIAGALRIVAAIVLAQVI